MLENKNNEVASYHLFTFSKINFLVVTRARKAFNYFKRGASVVWFPYVDFLFLFFISFLNIPVWFSPRPSHSVHLADLVPGPNSL